MLIKTLGLTNFRNYNRCRVEFADGINLFLGANAQGKTNILEAVRYVSLGRSHRTRSDDELIAWQQTAAKISVEFVRRDVPNILSVILENRKRPQIEFNTNSVKHSEIMGALNTVLFAPEDLLLVKGAPINRRRFLDSEISQSSPAYYRELLRYNHLLSQRNTLLKNIRDRRATGDMLDMWEEPLAAGAAKITAARLAAAAKLSAIAGEMQSYIAGVGERMSITYVLSGSSGDMPSDLAAWYAAELHRNRDKDIRLGHTSVGPHHDDLNFTLNGVNLRSFGSQGQQRTGILALKLAELKFLHEETGEYPVLLLDDVMSELDKSRREKLLAFIREETIQTLITATEEAYFPFEHQAKLFDVVNGNVQSR